jgi:ABC-type multidrug transport system permease subunit
VAQSVPLKDLNEQGFFPVDARDMGDAFTPEDGKDALGITITKRGKVEAGAVDERPPGMLVQIRLLFQRELMNLRRDVTAVGARFGLTIFLGTLIGIIFLNVGSSDSSVPSNLQSHFGGLIMVSLMSMFGTAQPALLAFPEERPVFLREYSTNHYSVVSYFVSRLTMEAFITALQILVQMLITYFLIEFQASFPLLWVIIYALAMASTALAVLLGCSVEDPKLGQELLPLLFVPQMLFAGFFVTPDLIPVWLRWAQYLCTLTYSIRLALVAEFEGCAKTTQSCKTLLDDIGADPDETYWYWIVLVTLFVVFRVGALNVLRKKATKFF